MKFERRIWEMKEFNDRYEIEKDIIIINLCGSHDCYYFGYNLVKYFFIKELKNPLLVGNIYLKVL
jgi:hypothetical protein